MYKNLFIFGKNYFMKASELRIGNMFMYGDRIAIVSATFKSHFLCETEEQIQLGNSLQSNFQPIPLTKEWLLRLGFEGIDSDIHDDVWEAPHTSIIRFWHYQDRTPENNGYLFEDFDSHPAIKYVHQLQNLYHALTGQELTIKE